MIAKAEYLEQGSNPRFLVTSLRAAASRPPLHLKSSTARKAQPLPPRMIGVASYAEYVSYAPIKTFDPAASAASLWLPAARADQASPEMPPFLLNAGANAITVQ